MISKWWTSRDDWLWISYSWIICWWISPPNGSRQIIEYITIASEGNGIDFGDLTDGRRSHGGTCSINKGIIWWWISTKDNVILLIDFVEIQTLGDALDFGDLLQSN